ncbi:MAG: alpha-mannosidase, partial [Anaerolineae bacterium]|nr:alpha-mannosidase [Anaerolineae bacterium]
MKFFRTQKIERLLAEVEAAVYRESVTIRHWKAIERDIPGAEAVDFDDSPWRDFALGDAWGGYDVVAWFRARVPIPESWEAPPRSGAARQRKLALRFLVGPREEGNSTAETLLYVNGEPLQAIDRWHEEAWLPPETCASGELSLALRAWSGVLQVPPVRHFRRAELVLIDERAERLAHVTRAILQAVHELGENDLRRGVMLEALHQVYLGINFNLPRNDRFYESIAAADRALSAQVEMWRAGRELKPHISAIGHAHIDLAWLWRLRHSREKAVRTFTTALHLMRQYPEYRFMHSAPQAYKFLKEDNPLIFERVRQRIADGRWELTGGMWVEADTNLIGSESLVRQFLYGQRFARAEFGVDMSVLWLPDAFGYSYALPQIALQSGMRAFVTSKLSWSQFNRFPYDTFIWRGVDGSDLLSHFITTPELENPAGSGHTYNGQITPRELWGIWNNYRQGDINDELLMLFGWGDGGGGPTREMLDRAETLRNLPGIPSVTLGKAEPYFDRLAERMRATDLPVWDDELYLEIHRGTYTSQAFLKRANRKAEILYHDAEWLAALSDALTGERAYPAAALREGWESILLHQFHDILPGSSIHEVYDDAREAYRRIEQIGCDALEAAQARIAATAPSEGESLLVFNSLSWDRSDVAIVPWAEGRAPLTVLRADGSSAPAQVVCEDETPLLLVEVEGVPSLGCRAYPLVPAPQQDALTVTPERLENDFWRIELNRVGQIRSLYDKRVRREVLARQSERDAGRANILQAFEDKPMNFDAWDIDIYYQEKVAEITGLAEAVVEETGPVRGALRLVWRYGDSTITQRLTIYRASPRIDFRTEVDWWEQQVLLKVAFPVAVRATRATYEIQFGS